VWLVIDALPASATITLNGVPLMTAPAAGKVAEDITPALKSRNTVTITLNPGDQLSEVALWIVPKDGVAGSSQA
jgi:hypothetical protein